MNKQYYLGIDLGTSSVKGLLRSLDGKSYKFKQTYPSQTPDGWIAALKALIAQLLPLVHGRLEAVAFSSQVGTYIIDGKDVISWQSAIGAEELAYIKSVITQDEFVNAISMPHPDLVSYPLPRLLYIQNHYGHNCEVLMPKELLIRALTGQTVTDVYSMRGLAHPETGEYANCLLERLGIDLKLPTLKRPTDLAGYVTGSAHKEFGLPEGTPVYLGCNDFYAGLLGMGICEPGDAFDLSGTSEHIGYISQCVDPQGFVSGGYFTGACTYGGTKSSGTSCAFAMENFGIEGLSMEALRKKPPIFLPYLNGERAPIFDEQARGVYFGLDVNTDPAALAYATLEGVVFSLYHISTSMGMPLPRKLICGGGSAQNILMNTLKATLFGCPVVYACDSDTSALGACMIAMTGSGCYASLSEAVKNCVTYSDAVLPAEDYREILLKRFNIYRELYPNLQSVFRHFDAI